MRRVPALPRRCRGACEVAANVVASTGGLNDGTTRLSIDGEPAYHYLAVSSYAEYAVVPESGAIKVRDDAPLDLIALVGCAVATGVGAVRNTAKVEPGATVVVIGCGGVGLSVVQGARLAGASRIVAVDLRQDKVDLAVTLGATDAVVGSGCELEEAVRALLPDGADYAFDAIGRTTTTESAIRLLGLGGTAVVVGIPPRGYDRRRSTRWCSSSTTSASSARTTAASARPSTSRSSSTM